MDSIRITRRSLLGGAAAAGAAALVAPVAGPIDAAEAAIGLDPEEAAIDPHGIHQAGIATPGQQHLVLAAFDVRADATRDDLIALLRAWQAAIVVLAQGRPLAGGAAGGAPADTGEALGQRADRLTVTVGFGPTLFDDRFGLAERRPPQLIDLPAFAGDALDPARSGGDLSVQCCAERRLVAEHALRALARIAESTATVRWLQAGFNEPPARPQDGSGRNLFGFKDGTANLRGDDDARMARNVWVDPSDGPAWLAGGTLQVYRRVLMRLRTWDESPLAEQEDAIGRRRASGAPFGGTREQDRVDNALTPARSHIRLANPRTGLASENERILRRGYSFHDGLAGGDYDAGLAFIAYQRDPRLQFVPMQERLAAGDLLNEYLVHTASAIFAIPPGTRPSGFVGETLLGDAAPRVTRSHPAADRTRPLAPPPRPRRS